MSILEETALRFVHGIPLPEEPQEEETNDIVLQLSEKMGIPMARNDISVSHRIRK